MSAGPQSLAFNRQPSCSGPPGAGWAGGEERQAAEMRGSQMPGCKFISDVKCSVTSPSSPCCRQMHLNPSAQGGFAGSGVGLRSSVLYKELALFRLAPVP